MDTIFRLIYRYKTIVKFVISGSTSASADLFLLYIFYGVLKVHLAISASIAFAGAFVISFVFHKFWTFRNEDKEKIPAQATAYFLIALANMAINAKAVVYLVDTVGIFYLYAQMMAGAVLSIVTFSALRFVIFRRKKRLLARATERSEKWIIVIDKSYDKAESFMASTGKPNADFEVVPYGGYACRIGCPATWFYSFVRFFNDVYQLSKRNKTFYCFDIAKTGLTLAIVKAMRPEVRVYCLEDEKEAIKDGGFISRFVYSKLQCIKVSE